MHFWWHSWEPGAFISALTDNLNSVCLRLSFTHSFPTYRSYNTPLPPIMMTKAIDLRSKCSHFRILVIGRANAGKTTLLKKVCNSVNDPEIFDPSGKKVRGTYCLRTWWVHQYYRLQLDPAVVQESSDVWIITLLKYTPAYFSQRGLHDINNQLIFKSNPQFIFHDSRGFESGSLSEIETVNTFITKRAESTDLPSQLHTIWCGINHINFRQA